MDFLNGFLKRYWSLVLNGILLIMLIFTTGYYLTKNYKEELVETESISLVEAEEEKPSKIYVDIKGAVSNPGVYEVDNISIINDAIKKAGGFTKKAYTNNINLSKRVESEMVIYVYTKTEYKDFKEKEEVVVENNSCPTTTYEIDSCIDKGSSVITSTKTEEKENSFSDNTQDKNVSAESTQKGSNVNIEDKNTKISINKASKEELMRLDGIGESKAESIIKYREEIGLFKSIEDIKNVSGIGDAAYEKIKDSITI